MSQNIKIRTKTSSSFSIYWEPYVFQEEGNPVDYAVKYRQKGGKFSQPTYTENKLQFTINDLQADTEYEVLVFASSENGEDTLLGKALLQTECFQDKKIITIESKVDIRAKTTSSNISLSWDAFVFPDGEVPVDYAIKYRPKGGKFSQPTYTENKLQFTIKDLQVNTEYEVLVFASSESGEDTLLGKALLQTECFQDKKLMITESKVDIRAKTTSSNISLSWDAFVFPDGIVPVDYAVKYRPKGGKFLRPIYTENKLQFTINDLQADTEYEVLVFASSENGEDTLLGKALLQTECFQDKKIITTNSKVDIRANSTSSNISLSWDAFVFPDGEVPVDYAVKYRPKGGKFSQPTYTENKLQFTINDLQADTEYEVLVFASSENGEDTLLGKALLQTECFQDKKIITTNSKVDIRANSTSSNISLSWDAFVFPDGEVPVDYAVKYRPKGGKFSQPTYTENKLQFTIKDLQADTEYEVLVLTSSESGQGTLICRTMLKTKCSEEKQPLSSANSKIETESTSNSFSICWKDFVCTDGNVPGYVNIKYKAKDSERWLVHQCNKNEFQVTIISNVRDDTEYEVKLFALNENATETLLETILIKTKSSLCRELISCSTKKEAKGHSYKHNVYSLNPTRIEVKRMGVRCCFFGSEKPVAGVNDMVKTILVFGETGAGKSTLIDAMFNYLAGVSHGDDFRFHLVHLTEDEKKKENITVLSQTDGITCYHVPHNQAVNFHLKIIDTPGFNDTRGKQFDKILPKQLENLFNENIIDSIDAICLVVPTAGARYIDSQKHVFNSFRELFAKDVEGNIIAILTHDDGASGKPKVLQDIQEAGINIDDGSYFRFNNANLFSQKSSLEEWEKRNRSFQMFFKKLCVIDPISLHHTKEVLKSRRLLEIEIENIRESIKTQFIKKNRKDMEISLSSLDTLLLSAGRHIEKLSKLALRPSITSLDEIFTSIENDKVREQDKDEKQILRNIKQLKRQGKSLLEMMNSI